MGVKNGPEAIEKFGGLQGVLEKVAEATSGNVDEIAALFPNVRAVAGVLPLATTNASDFNEALETVGGASDRTSKAFDEMAQGPGFQMNQLLTSLKNSSVVLGDAIAKTLGPYLQKLIDWVKKVADWFSKLPEPAKKIIIVITGIATAIGPLLLILGTMLPAIGALTSALPVLGGAFAALTGPIGIAVGAIAGIIAIGVLVWKNWDKIKEKASEIWNGIKDFFVNIWDTIKSIFQKHWDKILAILFPAVGVPVLIARNWDKVKEVTVRIWTNITDWIKDKWNAMVEFFKSIPGKIGKVFSTVKDIILSPFRAVWNGIEKGINWLIRQINKISFDVPNWVPFIGGKHFGFHISEISLPKFAEGGIIPEPTLLYGLKSMRPYAIAGERGIEVVSPKVGTTINQTFNLSDIVVREEADIYLIAKELFNLQQRGLRSVGIG